MLDGPLRSSDVKLRAFLKAEKRRPDSLAKPRMIFPRSPRYNLVLASWLKPFEHWLWGNLKSRVVSGVGNSRVVAKGLNQTQRANLIVRKMRTIPDCVVFEVDGRAFEAHVDVWQLQQEHAIYGRAYPSDRDLQNVLSKQLRNFGVTSNGVRFSRDGGRASGDFNTGMGNTLVMLAVVMGTMSQIRPICWDTLVDGDNALLFISRSDCHRVCAEFPNVATEISGHEMVLERPTSVVEEVRFGQSAPLRVKGGWQMVRDWRKVVSHSTSSHHHLREPRFAPEFIRGVAACESFLAGGVPILWAYTRNLMARTEHVGGFRRHFLRDYQVLGVPVESLGEIYAEEPDDEARQSFEKAFGVTPVQQRNIERELMEARVVTTGSASLDLSDVYGLIFE
uniref:RNA-directed RNA polymerase n=1 Tax=Riboviria sp. TaxID=2585031 RepID=A0A514D1E7_9VIRU|nr:MAG: RNA-dependent RNA polymerase [Riboviria sp.]